MPHAPSWLVRRAARFRPYRPRLGMPSCVSAYCLPERSRSHDTNTPPPIPSSALHKACGLPTQNVALAVGTPGSSRPRPTSAFHSALLLRPQFYCGVWYLGGITNGYLTPGSHLTAIDCDIRHAYLLARLRVRAKEPLVISEPRYSPQDGVLALRGRPKVSYSISTMAPSAMWTTTSARAARSSSWVTTTKVLPKVSRRWRNMA